MEFIIGLLFGIVLGIVIAYAYVAMIVKGRARNGLKKLNLDAANVGGKMVQMAALALLLGAMLLAQASPSFAQTATPVPLNIPTNAIFSETNNWMATFAPVAAIGIGISIALAVLGYLGKMIKSAFS